MAAYSCKRYIYHRGLNERKIMSAPNEYELDIKCQAQMDKWEERWQKQKEREARIKNDEDSKSYATEQTTQAENMQWLMDTIVIRRKSPEKYRADDFKDMTVFSEVPPVYPALEEIPPAPSKEDDKYNPKPSFFTKISKKKMSQFIDDNISEYNKDYRKWEQVKEKINQRNEAVINDYNEKQKLWEEEKQKFYEKQTEINNGIDMLFSKCRSGERTAIEVFYLMVMDRIELPFDFELQMEIEYIPEQKRLIAEIMLPTVNNLPKLKAVSYIKTRHEFKETYHTEAFMRKKYDNVIYQIVLLVLDNIFSVSLTKDFVDYAVINGRVHTIDKATGKPIQPVVLSLAIDRPTFENVNINAVDPKVWFRSVKGTSAASIAAVTPVAPVMNISREDKRFVDGYEVVDKLQEGVNLAAIDWQDFENLIRELFEKEFSYNGGEVKITQASRDGGVDAIAFDPDPIRGGKIVIQAKRYTNVVNVSAVRDLYGTVLNEGASKGILVTTSYYGNDAYAFAQGKPLTLIDGPNLMFLLEKHGYKARIDLNEAKELLRS